MTVSASVYSVASDGSADGSSGSVVDAVYGDSVASGS